jgi:5-dehydro-2-deoxygluconokinase
VRCLVRFHPDAPVDDRLEDETQLQAVQQAVLVSGHELVLQVIPPRGLPCDDRTIVRALVRLYNVGITPDFWALEAMTAATWGRVDETIAARDPSCRGVLVVLESAGDLAAAARSRSCRGFVARSERFDEESGAWLAGRIDDAALVAKVRERLEALARAWRQARKEAA